MCRLTLSRLIKMANVLIEVGTYDRIMAFGFRAGIVAAGNSCARIFLFAGLTIFTGNDGNNNRNSPIVQRHFSNVTATTQQHPATAE